MNIKQYVRFEDVDAAFRDVAEDTENVFLANQKLEKLEVRKAEVWDGFVASLDKFVASHFPNQATKDSALRMFAPDFMAEYDTAVEWLAVVKHSLAKSWIKVNSLRTMIDLARVYDVDAED